MISELERLNAERVFQRRNARRQQRLRVLRDRTPSESEDAYLVLVAGVLVVEHVQEAIGAGSDLRDVLEEPDDVGRRMVIGIASHVDERLAVHPPEIEEIGTGHRSDANSKLIDDLPQSEVIVVINCAFPDGDPAVVLEHTAILMRSVSLLQPDVAGHGAGVGRGGVLGPAGTLIDSM
ncbi:hypothetical protein [Streptomyces roseofulvus]|uniref:hypothetical protein n=1 Tax=Streptomyces roseofulvus TaxID=33902 RepID=UPI003D15CAAE